jgi:glycosyltransferase involved in cell wall biosynthesis
LAVVRAFRQAFEPGSGAQLLVKTVNAAHQPDNRDELTIAAADHPDIELRDGYLSATEIDSLIASADCVVSLHRAEGFGLPLARALRSGIPIVATDYGGNTDFMTVENSFPVAYAEATVPPDTSYPAGAMWAEPDVEAAASQLRRVFDDPADARSRARRGAAELAETHSPRVAGERMKEALTQLRSDSTPPSPERPGLRAVLSRTAIGRRIILRRPGSDQDIERMISQLERAGIDRSELEDAIITLRTGTGDAAVVARALARTRI